MAAVGGFVLGAGLAAFVSLQHARKALRGRLELESRLRRAVLPVLERRADHLGIPPSERGSNDELPTEVILTLARAIAQLEESAELPFGDTVEVSRDSMRAIAREGSGT